MVKTINKYEFIETFKTYNMADNFSFRGLSALFDYFEEIESHQMQPIELDVIAICCEYSEYESLTEFQDEYGEEYESLDDIREQTEVIELNEDSFIIAQF